MKEIKIRVKFLEELLGTSSNNKEIHAEFIASKAPDAKSREEEIEAIGVEAELEKAMTVFPRNEEGVPCIWDYQFKGFFKEACQMLRIVKENKSAKLTAFKRKIDGLVFPSPRMIPLVFDGEMGTCQRPLRGMTAQGERISLANSETIPAGATCEFTVTLLDDSLEKCLIEWLDYGKFKGMLQWRNSGKGKFTYEIIE